MRFTTAARNAMLDALDALARYASLHVAYSATGGNELAGGTPAYVRPPVSWAAASGGSKAGTVPLVFNVPPGSTVRWVGYWDAPVGGTCVAISPNGGGMVQAFVVPDTVADVLECAGHGFIDGDTVVVWAEPGDPLPAGLTEGTVYFVVSATADDLKLAATAGGPAVPIGAVGAGMLQRLVAETFGAQGTHTLTAVALSVD